ncbi:hypothetical protein HQ587_01600 [bacterium]|nr:hypothetical protein [bacterium]
MSKVIKAIGLLSGGLDSMLALRVILDQGIAVKVIKFWTPFFSKNIQTAESRETVSTNTDQLPDVLRYARELGCEVEVVDLSDGYLRIMHEPKHGFGRNVNPCIDCHIYMFDTGRRMMEAEGRQFVFTGEVLGQRPKSQQMQELKLIARRSGLDDRLLRPLSAKLMKPTLPESEGWIDREKLLNFHGRSRKPQIALAEKYGITEFPTPAGGCILTDPHYGNKVKDMFQYREKKSLYWEDYNLLRVGRQLRVSPELKLIVGRYEADNELLEMFVTGRTRLEPVDVPGPVVLIDKSTDPEHELIAARICARYCSAGKRGDEVAVQIDRYNGDKRIVRVRAFKPEEVEDWLI